jgi:hypothetical protein
MKRLSLAVLLIAAASAALAVPVATLGTIDYAEGSITISRAGRILADPNIEDPIQSGDLIKTGSDGMVVIALGRNTGMSGTLTVRSRSSLYLKLETANGQPKTSIDILAGSIGSKVRKLAGNPAMDVVTKAVVMAVRGTEFGVAYSINDATLVACIEGKVSVSSGADETSVAAGKAVEQREGRGIRVLPVAVSSVEKFTSTWIAEEISAFRADPIRALAEYEKLYTEKLAEFQQAYEPFQQSAILKKWLEEDRTGARINPLDPTTMKEKKEMAVLLLRLRGILFIFERVYYRVDELIDIVKGTEYEKSLIRKGVFAGDFLRSVMEEREQLAKKVALFRYAEALYAARNPDGDVFSDDTD